MRISLHQLVPLLLLAGCASVPKAAPDLDASAKAFEAPAGKSRIYIYRTMDWHRGGVGVAYSIAVDGKVLGATAPGTYLVADVDPGRRVVSALWPNGASVVNVESTTGAVYFVRSYVSWKVSALTGPGLQLVDETEGRKAVLKCSLAMPLQ